MEGRKLSYVRLLGEIAQDFQLVPLVNERILLEAEPEQYGTERNLITTKGGITNGPSRARRAVGVVCTFIALVFSLSDNDVSDDDDAKGERG